MTARTWNVQSEDGFLACYHATVAEVYRYAALLCGADRTAAEDLVQEVYLAAMTSARAGTLTEVNVGWFVTATRHRFIDWHRASGREQRRLELVGGTSSDAQPALTPLQLSGLPERARIALVLRYVDDLTVADVAANLGVSVHAAESLLARALQRLRRKEAHGA